MRKTLIVLGVTVVAITLSACQDDGDKSVDGQATSATTTADPSTSAGGASDGTHDTLWGPMHDTAPYLADVRAHDPAYVEDLADGSIQQDGYLANYAYIACEGLRKGWSVQQVIDDPDGDSGGRPSPDVNATLTYMIKSAAKYVCPDQNARING
jgi:hypothetical protein